MGVYDLPPDSSLEAGQFSTEVELKTTGRELSGGWGLLA
jgi:hypothetical protein